MGINPISPKINTIKGVQTAQTVSFGGALDKGAKTVEEVLNSRMPKSVKFMEKIKDSVNSELGSIIITALGTGLVAPIFIAFNPLSKTDEKTKKYTAMRQPVSAVLAIFIQAGVAKPLGNFVGYLSRIGKLGKSPYFNTSNLRDEDYFKNEFKKLGSSTRLKEAEYVETKMKDEADAVAKQLREQGTIVFSNNVKLEDKEVAKLINKTLDTYIDELNTKKAGVTDAKVNFKIQRAQLLTDPELAPRIKTMCNDLLNAKTDKEISNIIELYAKDDNSTISMLAKEFKGREIDAVQHRATGTISKIDMFGNKIDGCKHIISNADYITSELRKIDGAAQIDGVVSALKEHLNGNKNSIKIIEHLAGRLSDIKDGGLRKKLIDDVINAITDLKNANGNRAKIIEIYQRLWYANEQTVLDGRINILNNLKVGENATNLKEVIANVEQGLNKSLKKDKFLSDMVSTWKKICSSRLKGLKQITTLLTSVFITLPITCTALNWVYPRFMDIFFPSLSKNGKSSAPDKNAKVKEGK